MSTIEHQGEVDYKGLTEKIIIAYTEMLLSEASRSQRLNMGIRTRISRLNQQDRRFLQQINGLVSVMDRYKDPIKLDSVADFIDLGKIYENVDKREQETTDEHLKYEDFVVLEVLRYFKNDFFKWVNKPECPVCHNDGDNVVAKSFESIPGDDISIIEKYECIDCNQQINFPRHNDPVKLLLTRSGRCGEWVNCFMLILLALLGAEAKLRYVWNAEDHVWCEYYSRGAQKWIHLDPCEGVADEPHLYCENWGKRMSWCIGFGDSYIMDLSDKYVTKEKQISKDSVISDPKLVGIYINDVLNRQKLETYFLSLIDPLPLDRSQKMRLLYNEIVLLNREKFTSDKSSIFPARKDLPKGRQSGDKAWTAARGESNQ